MIEFLLTVLCGLLVYIWKDSEKRFTDEMKLLRGDFQRFNIGFHNFVSCVFTVMCDISPDQRLRIKEAEIKFRSEQDRPNGKGFRA